MESVLDPFGVADRLPPGVDFPNPFPTNGCVPTALARAGAGGPALALAIGRRARRITRKNAYGWSTAPSRRYLMDRRNSGWGSLSEDVAEWLRLGKLQLLHYREWHARNAPTVLRFIRELAAPRAIYLVRSAGHWQCIYWRVGLRTRPRSRVLQVWRVTPLATEVRKAASGS